MGDRVREDHENSEDELLLLLRSEWRLRDEGVLPKVLNAKAGVYRLHHTLYSQGTVPGEKSPDRMMIPIKKGKF